MLADPAAFLEEAILASHRELHRYRAENSLPEAPRTTVVACVIQQGLAMWAHAGDSRLYLIRGPRIAARTVDHSRVHHLVSSGLISDEDAKDHPERNRIYNCVGAYVAPTVDISHPMASRFPADYFYDLQGQRGRHIVSVEPGGGGFAQTSTRGLRGRKLFLWGNGPAGSRWQEWLCGPGARYAEIQAGWCPTQLEHDRLAGGASVSWTEAFGGVDLDRGAVAHGYGEACAAAQAAVHEA